MNMNITTKDFEIFFKGKNLKDLSDKWLGIYYQYAIELNCKRYLKAIEIEIQNRKV